MAVHFKEYDSLLYEVVGRNSRLRLMQIGQTVTEVIRPLAKHEQS
jgi:hypothetical protein